MKLSILLKLAKIEYKPSTDPEIDGICTHSGLIRKGQIYVAIEGLHVDGHAYLNEAVRRGAVCAVITSRAVEEGKVNPSRFSIPLVVVEDTRAACAMLFAAWYGNPQSKLKLIGVTGTNGKTTVSRLIYEILSRAGIKTGVIGTLGCVCQGELLDVKSRDPDANMTTPDPEELYRALDIMVQKGTEIAVMEVSSHALAFEKVKPIVYDVAVFTNLTEDHLDLHGDMEHYFEAKAKLFTQCKRAVINIDDRYGRRLAEMYGTGAYTCSAEGRGAVSFAEDVHEKGILGIEYKLSSHGIGLRVRSPMSGRFNVMNTMQSAITAHLLGLPAREIQTSLALLRGAEGRLEKLKLEGISEFSVYVDYAHTPDALENLLRTVRSFASKDQRIVLLFGCGGDRDRHKRSEMGKIATLLADHVVITSDNSRSEKTEDIIGDILKGVVADSSFTVIENRRDAIEYAIKNARWGDIILLAGKGHENYEIGADGKKPFSEKEIVSAAVHKYFLK